MHSEHVDSAAFDVLVEVGADGSIQVNFTNVVLEVDASHSAQQACDDPLCTVCKPSPDTPVAGSPPLPQTCETCVLDFVVNSATKRCEPAVAAPFGITMAPPEDGGGGGGAAGTQAATSPALPPPPGWLEEWCQNPGAGRRTAMGMMDVLHALQHRTHSCMCGARLPLAAPLHDAANCKQVNPADSPTKPCGTGWFIINEDDPAAFWCARCNRPGCQDCKSMH